MPKTFVILPRAPDRLFVLIGPVGNGQSMLQDFDSREVRTVSNAELGYADLPGDQFLGEGEEYLEVI